MSSVAASTSLRDARDWLSQERAKPTSVERVAFGALDRWSSTPPPARLVHASGGFFSIDRIRSRDDRGAVVADRAFVNQAEIGILGFLTANVDGAEHLLVQAKFEPGNVGGVQFAPTVQATVSNYRQIHGGAATPYLEYFIDPSSATCDVEQPEQPSLFVRKRNRNVVVALDRPIDAGPGHRWIRSTDVLAMLADDNAINMHARSVLACLLYASSGSDREASTAVGDWLAARSRASAPLSCEPLALDIAPGDLEVVSEDGTSIVIAASVRAPEREVTAWMQPMLSIGGRGVLGLLVRDVGSGTELLCQAIRDPVEAVRYELGPTLIRYGVATPVPFLYADRFDESSRSAGDAVIFDALHSEAGGRFFEIESRYAIVLAASGSSEEPPPDFRWFRMADVAGAVASGLASSELRSLIACLPEEFR